MDHDQDFVAAILRSIPPPDVPGDFVARVNARIDATAGWFGLADFRVWTLRLAPAAAALALVGVFWSSQAPASTTVVEARAFSPSSSTDWQQDMTGDALLDAALTPAEHAHAR